MLMNGNCITTPECGVVIFSYAGTSPEQLSQIWIWSLIMPRSRSQDTIILAHYLQRWLIQTRSKTYGDGPRVKNPDADLGWRT